MSATTYYKLMSVKNPTAYGIYEHILRSDPNKEYTYIIVGRPGPTGKSTLQHKLYALGYIAYELTEELLVAARIEGNRNAFVVNGARQYVLVVLNEFVR